MYSQGPYSSVPYLALEGPAADPGKPFAQTEWPNPVRATPAVVTQLTWTDAFKLPLQQELPSRQTEWPNPRGYVPSIDLRTIINPALIAVPPEIPNVMNYDWPNPRGPVSAISLLTWTVMPTWTLTFVPEMGRGQRFWPNPSLGPRRLGPDWVRGSTWLISQPPPVISQARNRDWPNPRGPRRAVDLLTFINQTKEIPETPSVPPQDMMDNRTGRVRYLKNDRLRLRFLAKNPNT
jgi:hypothetical protein